MKRAVVSFLMLALAVVLFGQAEVYNIIKVDGEIINRSTGKPLTPGDVIKPTDQLEFKSNYAMAIAISSTRGKFTIRLPEQDQDLFDNSQLLAMANTAASPIESRAQLSVRAVGVMEVKDLKKYLGIDNFYILGDKLSVRLSKTFYPLDENNFIVLTYQGKDKTVSKKLGFTGQTIDIDKNQIVSSPEDLVNGTTLPKVSVFKYDNLKKSSSLITQVNLVFLNSDQVKKEFEVIIPLLKEDKKSRSEAADYLRNYFYDIYGATDPDALFLLVNMALKDYSS